MRGSFALACLIAISAGTAHAGELPRTIGLHPPTGPGLALLDSKIEVTVRGPIVEAVVTQRFQNRSDHATEATYVFPLPVDAAVSAMAIKNGARTIHASIEKREEAQRRYETAVRQGVAAALLDQERPDVFTQTVAAIPAKGTVEITLRFDTMARYQSGVWELVLPLVVAPRYVPGTATNRPTTGTGRAPDTDRAPDASRVTPGGAPGAGGATEVVIRFVDKPSDVTSPTHELRVSGPGGTTDATFVDPKTDHDAIVRWKATASAAGWVEQGTDGGFAAVVVESPAAPVRKGSMRCLLVLDRSAASRGDADAVARPLVRTLLGSFGQADRVAVAGSDQLAWATPADISRALEQAWPTPAGAFDLTRVLTAVRPDGAPIILVSGGLVADDRAAIAAAAKLGVAVHVIGVGPAPARGVLAQVAAASGGTLRFAVPGDDLGVLAKATVADAASQPAPLTVTWGTLAASDVVPGTLPRLGTGQATLVLARVKRAQTANGRARGELFAIETLSGPRTVDGATTAMGPLARRWARNRLDELVAQRANAGVVTAHALRYGLVSPYTSMVAIGDEVVVQGGVKRSVAIPVSVPAGMKWQQVKKETTVEVDGIDAPRTGDKSEKPKDQPTTRSPARPDATRPTVTVKRPTDPTKSPPAKRQEPATTDTKSADKDQKKAKEPKQPTGSKKDKLDKPTGPTSPGGGVVVNSRLESTDPTSTEPRRKRSGDEDDDRDGAEDAEDTLAKPSKGVATRPEPETDEGRYSESISTSGSSSTGKRWRLATSFAGGFLRSQGATTSLLSLGARFELRVARRAMVGFDGALWLVDGNDVAGHALASFALRGLGRWFELGLGVGAHFGDGAGPAGAFSLRFHLPPQPRASTYLRYDGALITKDGDQRGQSTLTLGVEWGF